MPEIAVNYWFWLSLGLLLIVIEMVVPGVFFLWFGIGAFATGLIALICGGLAIKYLTAIFAILSVIAIYLGRKYFKPGMEIKNGLNDSSSKYTGKIVKANGDFENGQGSVILGDTVWQAESADTVLSGQAPPQNSRSFFRRPWRQRRNDMAYTGRGTSRSGRCSGRTPGRSSGSPPGLLWSG